MPRTSYQYGTSPRKYEPEYTPRTITRKPKNKKTTNKKGSKQVSKKSDDKKQKVEKVKQTKNRTLQVTIVLFVFGMLLALSYREITIMEMFNQKKDLEKQLSVIQKENGQIEKSIREEESKLDWNYISQTAKEQLGMQAKTAIPVDLEKSDNVETKNKFIKEEESNFVEDIIAYFINK